MTNNKHQTVVEWYDNEIAKLLEQFLMGKIKLYEFRNKRFKLEQQAKEMEKEQMIGFAYKALMEADSTVNGLVDVDELYNEIYGGGKQ